MPVLAADADAEDEPAGGDPGQVGELAGDQDGVAERQEVHAAMDGQRGVKHEQRGGLDQAVEAHAAEADVVAAAERGRCPPAGLRQERAGGLRVRGEQAEGRKHADADGGRLGGV